MSSPPSDTNRLPFFVYGTLQSGFKNHNRVLSPFKFCVEDAEVDGVDLYHFDSEGYPGAFPGTGVIKGQLITAEGDATTYDAMLKAADELEEFVEGQDETNLYNRVTKSVRRLEGGEAVAWVYICNRIELTEDGVRVESGNWRDFMMRTGREDSDK